jgi:hypothetical protein
LAPAANFVDSVTVALAQAGIGLRSSWKGRAHPAFVAPKGAAVNPSMESSSSVAIVSMVWRKSMASGSGEGGGSGCIEVAVLPGLVMVRDSKDVAGPQLKFTSSTWRGFVGFSSTGNSERGELSFS